MAVGECMHVCVYVPVCMHVPVNSDLYNNGKSARGMNRTEKSCCPCFRC